MSKLQTVREKIKGKKKWIALAIVILTAVIDWSTESIGLIELAKTVLNSLGS